MTWLSFVYQVHGMSFKIVPYQRQLKGWLQFQKLKKLKD